MSNVAAGKDTDDEGESLNDVEKVLNKLDIKLRDSVGEWRSFEDVLDEVATKWKDFSEVERSQIATAIAGTRQQETFRALMNNYEEVGRLAGVAADSAGSASKRMEIYLDSVEAKTNELKSTWEEFILNLGQSEGYKDFLDFLINILGNMPIVMNYLKAIIALIVAIKAQKIVETAQGFITALKNITVGTKGLLTNILLLSSSLTKHKTIVDQNTLSTIQKIAADEKLELVDKGMLIQQELIAAGWSKEDAIEKVNMMTKEGHIVVTNALTTATGILTASLSVLTLVLSAGMFIFAAYSQSVAKAKQEAEDFYKTSHDTAEAERDKTEAIKKAKEEYENIYATTKDYEERQQKLNDLNVELKTTLGDVADTLNIVSGSYETTINKMDEYAKKQEEVTKNATRIEYDAAKGLLGQQGSAWGDIRYKLSTPISMDSQFATDISNIVGGYGGNWGSVWNRSGLGGNTAEMMELNNSTPAEEAMKIIDKLQAYYEENINKLTTGEAAAVQGFINAIKKQYGEDVVNAWNTIAEYELEQFKKDNETIYTEYENLVTKIKDLKEKYDKSSLESEKTLIKGQLEDLEKQYNTTYDNLTQNASTKIKQSLKNSFNGTSIDEYLGFEDNGSNINWEKVGTTTTIAADAFQKVNEEIENTGTVTQETINKLTNLWELLQKEGNGIWLQNFIDQLEKLGLTVPTSWKETANTKGIQELLQDEEEGISKAKQLQEELNVAKQENEQVTSDIEQGQSTIQQKQQDVESQRTGGRTAVGLTAWIPRSKCWYRRCRSTKIKRRGEFS